MAAEEVNAYYQAETNQMVFPAGILKSPFYSADFPMYVSRNRTLLRAMIMKKICQVENRTCWKF